MSTHKQYNNWEPLSLSLSMALARGILLSKHHFRSLVGGVRHKSSSMSNFVSKDFRYIHEAEVPTHLWDSTFPSGNTPDEHSTQAWRPSKRKLIPFVKRQRTILKPNRRLVPEKFLSYDPCLEKYVSYEEQLSSLKKRGFLRAYKPYTPPEDVEARFMSVCAEILPNFQEQAGDITKILLSSPSKGQILCALHAEFQHKVPNSLIHTMVSLDHVFLFYNTTVDVRTPYEKLHESRDEGQLPPNLNIQLRAARFDPKGDHWTNRTTAYPGTNTIIVDPENRKKYKDVISARDPWEKNAWD
eukprot:maker-scaffold693_size110418-snap-gene-0.24 protein:Tk06974 transcript:maker-scaffold693_size110418-snap-gene-0.24-mRNA-1 annotation:"mitochondrial 39s ribosomal protein l50"